MEYCKLVAFTNSMVDTINDGYAIIKDMQNKLPEMVNESVINDLKKKIETGEFQKLLSEAVATLYENVVNLHAISDNNIIPTNIDELLNDTPFLYVPAGIYIGNINVKNPNTVIYGAGTINGSITIDVPNSDNNDYPPFGNIVITGISIKPLLGKALSLDYTQEESAAIILKNVRGFSISNVYISNARYGIYYNYNSITAQRVIRGRITDNYIDADTCVYFNELNENIFGGVADIAFANNHMECITYNFYAKSIDGCKLNNETYFMPGFQLKRPEKRNNVYVEKVNWLTISNCTFFEAGYEGIVIKKSRNTSIVNNIIGWCGQFVPSSGILLYGTDTSNIQNTLNAVISGNVINTPTKSGIEVPDRAIQVSVSNNQMCNIGKSTYYYGVIDLNEVNHYGIHFPNCEKYDSVSVTDNTATNANHNITLNAYQVNNIDPRFYPNTSYLSSYLRLNTNSSNAPGSIWYDNGNVKFFNGTQNVTMNTNEQNERYFVLPKITHDSGQSGFIWFDTSDNKVKIWNGTEVKTLSFE